MENGVITNKPIILFGAGRKGKEALDYYGKARVFFFADNHKAGLYYYGVPVISVEDLRRIHKNYHVIISTASNLFDEISEQLERMGICDADFFLPDYKEKYMRNPHLEVFKDMHKGECCFIIGNGPSLKAEDLSKIAETGYTSFASNKIYKMFEKTKWRPDYYFASDGQFIMHNWDAIQEFEGNIFLAYIEEYITPDMLYKLIGKDNVNLFRARYLQQEPSKNACLPIYAPYQEPYPSFSQDAAKFVYEGFSVTYLMMQWAAYMGFAKICLLGVDHHFAHTCNYFEQVIPPQTITDTINRDHFCVDYYKAGESIYISDVNSTEQAYKKAEQYSQESGFRIYNATRGGKLEVFQRVDFDKLIDSLNKQGGGSYETHSV